MEKDKGSEIVIELDGLMIKCSEGENLAEVLQGAQIPIIRLCCEESTNNRGHCNLCLAENCVTGEIFRTCEVTINSEMHLSVNSKQVQIAIKESMAKLLSGRPALCNECIKLGECQLQESFRKLPFELAQKITIFASKESKGQIVDLGKNIVFDEKFCIACGRCVAFLANFTKSNEIRPPVENEDEWRRPLPSPLKNEYVLNLPELCPTAALSEVTNSRPSPLPLPYSHTTICIGCPATCPATFEFDNWGPVRLRPIPSSMKKSRWMCDFGRKIVGGYKYTQRLHEIVENYNGSFSVTEVGPLIERIRRRDLKLVLPLDLFNEEYEFFFKMAKKYSFKISFFKWPNSGADFDGILKRGSHNCNEKGMEAVWKRFRDFGLVLAEEQFFEGLSKTDVVLMVLPEIISDSNFLFDYVGRLGRADFKVAFSVTDSLHVQKEFNYLFPASAFFEKNGTVTNVYGEDSVLRFANWPFEKQFFKERGESLITRHLSSI